jgi:DNA excision repair protein ERCC-1
MILVNSNQRGNPILKFIKQWEHADIGPDYQIGKSAVLFLSIKYHQVHPEYIYNRLGKLHGDVIILCLQDADDKSLTELSIMGVDLGFTLLVSWSEEECANYLVLMNTMQSKSPEMIRGSTELDPFLKLSNSLTEIKTMNKTDVVTLTANFSVFELNKSLYNIIHADPEQINLLPGFGIRKTSRLQSAFETPFMSS